MVAEEKRLRRHEAGLHHPIGPLALADFIGLDVLLAVMQTIHDEFSESKYRPCPLLREMVAARLSRAQDRPRGLPLLIHANRSHRRTTTYLIHLPASQLQCV